MTMRLLAGAAMALLAAGDAATAADLGFPTKAAGMSWTGCHVGIQGGLGAGHNTWRDQPAAAGFVDANAVGETANTDMSGGLVGGQVGCDMQFSGAWVAGIQGMMAASDIAGTNMDQFNDTWSLRTGVSWLAAGTGRLGFAVNNVLLYGRAGGAWAHDRFEIENADVNLGTPQATRLGWTAGAGMEWLFAPNWSAFLEVDYYGFSGTNVAFPGNAAAATPSFIANTSLSLETFQVGVNYRF